MKIVNPAKSIFALLIGCGCFLMSLNVSYADEELRHVLKKVCINHDEVTFDDNVVGAWGKYLPEPHTLKIKHGDMYYTNISGAMCYKITPDGCYNSPVKFSKDPSKNNMIIISTTPLEKAWCREDMGKLD